MTAAEMSNSGIRVLDWFSRHHICLECGATFHAMAKFAINTHLHHMHKCRFARSGTNYLIYSKQNGSYVFYVRTRNSKSKRIVDVSDKQYGKRVERALQFLEGTIDG